MGRGIDGIEPELLAQRDLLASREPGYARVCELLVPATRGVLGVRLQAAWTGRDFNAFYERPLLLLAALRYEALSAREAHPLRDALTGVAPSADGIDERALEQATAPERTGFYRALRERAVQTNETTRALTWLWPASLLARAGEQRGIALVDLGTSAGLNLIADELPTVWTDEHGASIPLVPRPGIGLRLGLDISPLDVRSEDAATWLRACVWASDKPRLLRLEEAVARFRTNSMRPDGPRLERCTLPDAPARIAALPGDMLLLCVQTIVRDYLSPGDRERYEQGMRALLLRRAPRSMLWAELELDPSGGSMEQSAALSVRFVEAHGELRELRLGRTHPHPRQVFREAEAEAQLMAAWRAV